MSEPPLDALEQEQSSASLGRWALMATEFSSASQGALGGRLHWGLVLASRLASSSQTAAIQTSFFCYFPQHMEMGSPLPLEP